MPSDAGAGWYALAPGFALSAQADDVAAAGEGAPAGWPQAAVPVRPGMPNDLIQLFGLGLLCTRVQIVFLLHLLHPTSHSRACLMRKQAFVKPILTVPLHAVAFP